MEFGSGGINDPFNPCSPYHEIIFGESSTQQPSHRIAPTVSLWEVLVPTLIVFAFIIGTATWPWGRQPGRTRG